ncbi:hypothetical protein TWF730_008101 [Orbilia blumenaviensis]|uniref:Uncharacterized protein n=1 Tax=Orbilia blumenaviensis TaxID=1796055 RepID=A0AAV9V9X0_9PEZI
MRFHAPLLLLGLATTALALPKGQREDANNPGSSSISKPTGTEPTHSVFTDGPSFTLPSVPPRPPSATSPPPVPTGGVPPENRNDRPPQSDGTGAPPSGTASPPPKPTGTDAPPSKPTGTAAPASSGASVGSSNQVKGKVGIVKPN